MLQRNLPNFLTLGNLLCGCLGIQQILAGNPELAPYFVIASGILDFFDGMLARALGVLSNIGKDLDSLADVVSFGVLPGFMAFFLISSSDGYPDLSGHHINEAYIAFLIPILSAFRLAKFNNDERQSSSFIGMPTPANGFFWTGVFYAVLNQDFMVNTWVIVGTTIVMSVLLISELPMFSFKFKKGMDAKLMWPQLLLLIIAVPALIFYKISGFAIIVLSYILISIAVAFSGKIDLKQE